MQPAIVRFGAPTLFFLLGAAALGTGLVEVRAVLAAEGWPAAEGIVTASEVRSEITEVRQNNRTRRVRVYDAAVTYEFTVDGATHRGERVRFASFTSSSPESAERDVARFPVGSRVPVYYDPEDPDACVLERGLEPTSFLLPGLGLVFLLASLGMGYLLNR
jgi:hypothetical protein